MAKGTTEHLDDLDWQILHLLQSDARSTFAEIGRQVHLSLSAVAERVRKLEDNGILVGYHASVDPAQVGLPIQAFIRVASNKENCPRVVALAQSLSEVREGYRITGAESYLLKIYATSVAHLEQLINEFSALGEVITSIVLSAPIYKPIIEQHPREAELSEKG